MFGVVHVCVVCERVRRTYVVFTYAAAACGDVHIVITALTSTSPTQRQQRNVAGDAYMRMCV